MADDTQQDGDLVKSLFQRQGRMESERAPYEGQYREADERVDPMSGGLFAGYSPGTRRGRSNFDTTAVRSMGRFAAVMSAITVPRRSQYIRPKFGDKDLDKLPAVRRWCANAGDRIYAMRYAPHTGFGVAVNEDFRQLGKYGTAPFWVDVRPGLGFVYRSLHLSECWIGVDYTGMTNRLHRKFSKTAEQCAEMYGKDALTEKMRKAIADGKGGETEFEILHVVQPNPKVQDGKLDYRGKRVESIHIAIDDKRILRRAGFRTSPISASRHGTSSGDIYGYSPAFTVMPSINGVNVMQQTILRSAHKMVDPALAFYDDDGITSLVTKPGGANPGLVDASGRLLVQPLPTGSNLPIGLEMVEAERDVIRSAFLEEYFQILTDPSDRMTATQVLETMSKQGVLVAPYADRYETETLNPVTQRELDAALEADQLEPFPPEVIEAGAWPQIEYENPLSRMARAEEAAGFTRWIETMAPMAQLDEGAVFDHVDVDEAAAGLAEVLGVRPNWIATPEKVAAKRSAREESKAQAAGVEQLATAAGAYADIAKGNQIAAAV